MSSNLPLVRRSRRVLPYGWGGRKLEINIPPQQIYANSKRGLIIKGSVMSSEYGSVVLLQRVTILSTCVYTHTVYTHTVYTHTVYTRTVYVHTVYTHTVYAHTVYTHTVYVQLLRLHISFPGPTQLSSVVFVQRDWWNCKSPDPLRSGRVWLQKILLISTSQTFCACSQSHSDGTHTDDNLSTTTLV